MPRTRAQRRATQGPLGGLNDDALRRVLTFLSVADSRRGAGGASKALRGVATSNELTRLRGSESYVLRRGSHHDVVHALATSFGTQPWRRVSFSFNVGTHQYHLARDVTNAAMPPSRLRIIAHRNVGDRPLATHLHEDAVFPFQVVDRDANPDLSTIGECCVLPGTFAEFHLPFQLQLSDFRLAHGPCNACRFRDWVLEAFDGERWNVLYECHVSPWPSYRPEVAGPNRYFHIDATGVASSRFRLRLLDIAAPTVAEPGVPLQRCFHIRALELFGTVLPPWSV